MVWKYFLLASSNRVEMCKDEDRQRQSRGIKTASCEDSCLVEKLRNGSVLGSSTTEASWKGTEQKKTREGPHEHKPGPGPDREGKHNPRKQASHLTFEGRRPRVVPTESQLATRPQMWSKSTVFESPLANRPPRWSKATQTLCAMLLGSEVVSDSETITPQLKKKKGQTAKWRNGQMARGKKRPSQRSAGSCNSEQVVNRVTHPSATYQKKTSVLKSSTLTETMTRHST